MNWEGIAAFVGALGVIILGIAVPIINSGQKRKEKEWDLLLEKRFKEKENKENKERFKLNEIHSKVYAYLWKLLFSIDADRVFIIQPHPLTDKQYLSVSFEVVHPNRDVASRKESFQFKKFSEWSRFAARLGTEDFMVYDNVKNIDDKKIFAEVNRRGVNTAVFKKLYDEEGYWEGSLCVEYTHRKPDAEELGEVKRQFDCKADLIADILPEYRPIKEE